MVKHAVAMFTVVSAAAFGQGRLPLEAAIRQADEAWLKAVAAKSIDQTVAIYDPDVLTAGSAMLPARGLAEIRTMWAKYFADASFTLTWNLQNVVIAESRNVGYSFGTWSGRGNGGPYLAVWRKQPGGIWKVVMDAAWLSAKKGSGGAESPELLPSTPADAIRQTDEACLAALAEKSLEREVACYDAGALIVDNGTILARGLAEIRTMFSKYFTDPNFALTWKAEKVAVVPSGNLGYSSGAWHGGGETGPYFAVWEKQPDGKWKLLIDCTWTQPRK